MTSTHISSCRLDKSVGPSLGDDAPQSSLLTYYARTLQYFRSSKNTYLDRVTFCRIQMTESDPMTCQVWVFVFAACAVGHNIISTQINRINFRVPKAETPSHCLCSPSLIPAVEVIWGSGALSIEILHTRSRCQDHTIHNHPHYQVNSDI